MTGVMYSASIYAQMETLISGQLGHVFLHITKVCVLCFFCLYCCHGGKTVQIVRDQGTNASLTPSRLCCDYLLIMCQIYGDWWHCWLFIVLRAKIPQFKKENVVNQKKLWVPLLSSLNLHIFPLSMTVFQYFFVTSLHGVKFHV